MKLTQHLSDLLRLAAPVVVARAGIMVMALVDTIVVARFSTEQLAFQGIGNAPVQTMLVGLIGMMMGVLVGTANAFGAGRLSDCGAVWRRSVPYALGLGLVGTVVCLFGETVLTLLGQPAELAQGGGPVMRVLGLGLPAHLVFVASGFFLEGVKRPMPAMLFMLVANLLNLLLNVWLVFGGAGIPALGAMGAAWATTLVRIFLATGLVWYIWNMPGHEGLGIRTPAPGGWRDWAWQRRIGYGAGASYGLEASAFGGVAIYAGWLGAMPLAAYSVTLNATALVFMVSLGLASATAVRVGIAHGKKNPHEVAVAGWIGLATNSVLMLPAMAAFGLVPMAVAAVYSSDPALVAFAAPMVWLAAWMVLCDGAQAVMSHALRARGDVLLPTILHVLSYGGVMLPLCWFLAFPAGRESIGLMEGIVAASIFAAAVLCGRYAWLDLRRQA